MSLFPRMSSASAAGAPGAFRHEFNPFLSLFNDTFNELQRLSDQFPTAARNSSVFAPKFDVKEAADAYTLEGELPGIARKDLTIEFTDENTLTVKGRTETVREEGTRPTSAITGAAKVSASDPQGAITSTTSSEGAPAPADGTTNTTNDGDAQLTHSGSKEIGSPAQNQRHTYWVSERSMGEFQRSFNFANRVDHDNIKASLKDGILSIVVPKLNRQSTARRITIESE